MTKKIELITQALDSFEDIISNNLVKKAEEKERKELQMIEFLYKDAANLHAQNTAEIKKLGIAIKDEFKTDNLEFFANMAGDSSYFEMLGKMTQNYRDKADSMDSALVDYSRGIELSKKLRKSGAFTTQGEIGIDAITANEEEIKNIGFDIYSQEDRNNPYFTKGFEDKADIVSSATLAQLNDQLITSDIQRKTLQTDNDIQNLVLAKETYATALGKGGQIVFDQLNNYGMGTDSADVFNFQEYIGLFDKTGNEKEELNQSYDVKIAGLRDKYSYSPLAVSHIENAIASLRESVSPVGQGNYLVGFGKLPSHVRDVSNFVKNTESNAIASMPNALDANGIMTKEATEILMKENAQYAEAKNAFLVYSDLGLNFPNNPGLLDMLAGIRQDEVLIDAEQNRMKNKAMDAIAGNFGYDYNQDISNLSPETQLTYLDGVVEDNAIVSEIFNNNLDISLDTVEFGNDASIESITSEVGAGVPALEQLVAEIQDTSIQEVARNNDASFTSILLDESNFVNGQFANEELFESLDAEAGNGSKQAAFVLKQLDQYAGALNDKNHFISIDRPEFIQWKRIEKLAQSIEGAVQEMGKSDTGFSNTLRYYGIRARALMKGNKF